MKTNREKTVVNVAGFPKPTVHALQEKIERVAALQHGSRYETLPLANFMPHVTPKIGRQEVKSPRHLQPILDALTEFENGKPIRACFSVPPQHGKTQLLIHGIVWYMLRNVGSRCLYASYSQTRASRLADDIKRIVKASGSEIVKDTQEEIRIDNGGLVHFRSLEGPILGESYDLIVIDDPHKSWTEAVSPTISKRIFSNFTTTVESRIDPTRTGIIVVHQRLARTDLIGRLSLRGSEYQVTNLPAIKENGRPLWPLRFSPSNLKKIKDADPDRWQTLYMGVPTSDLISTFKPKGISFKHPQIDQRKLMQRIYGIDVGSSGRGDKSAIVELARHTTKDEYYVFRAWQGLSSAEEFAGIIKSWVTSSPAPVLWHGSGQECAVAESYRLHHGIDIDFIATNKSKMIRAMGVAKAWNAKHIHLPPGRNAGIDSLVQCLLAFSGNSRDQDDLVDALSSAWIGLQPNKEESPNAADMLHWGAKHLPRSAWS